MLRAWTVWRLPPAEMQNAHSTFGLYDWIPERFPRRRSPGQLGTFITNTAFSDEAYDEFIRCSTKYPQILVDLVSGNELQDRLIAHRLGVAEGTGGLLELKGEYFTS